MFTIGVVLFGEVTHIVDGGHRDISIETHESGRGKLLLKLGHL